MNKKEDQIKLIYDFIKYCDSSEKGDPFSICLSYEDDENIAFIRGWIESRLINKEIN